MEISFWPDGNIPSPKWTPINGHTGNLVTNQTLSRTGATMITQPAWEITGAAALRSDVWNERLRVAAPTLLQDVAKQRPADATNTDKAAKKSKQEAASSLTTMTDNEILAGGLEYLEGGNLLQVASTHRNQEIIDKINADYDEPIISADMLSKRLTRALDKQSKLEGRPRAEIKQELDEARSKNGVFRRKYEAIGVKRRIPTPSLQKLKGVSESPQKSLEMYGSGHVAKATSIFTSTGSSNPKESADSDEEHPLCDLEEMSKRVSNRAQSNIMNGNEGQPPAMEQQSPRYEPTSCASSSSTITIATVAMANEKSRSENDRVERRRIQNRLNQRAFHQRKRAKDSRMLSEVASTLKSPTRAYERDQDGDTTDEGTRTVQIMTVEQRKQEAKEAKRQSAARTNAGNVSNG